MMKKGWFLTSLIFISLFFLGSCSLSQADELKVNFEKEFALSVGQTAVFEEVELKIKFVSVSADSRCPQGVTCIWAGEAKCQVYIGNDRSFSLVDLTDGGGINGYSETIFKNANYNLKLAFKLAPYPEKDKQIDSGEYKLILTVTRLG